MTLTDAIRDACKAAGIVPPSRVSVERWIKCAVDGKAKSNTSGRVYVFADGRGGIAHNWATGEQVRFQVGEELSPVERRELSQEAKKRDRARIERASDAARVASAIVQTSRSDGHGYLERKGFPEALGLVHDNPARHFSGSPFEKSYLSAFPEGEGPWLIVPGRGADKQVKTVQFIGADGVKKNLAGGSMKGAAHRIATGHETWVCEGIATAMTIRAALAMLGRSASVYTAFAASNMPEVAKTLKGAILGVDNDKPLEQFGGVGTGEYYARKSGCQWIMPADLGDWNDHHAAHGLRSVALAIRETKP